MKSKKLPPGQSEIDSILRWNVDHPGIVPRNPPIDLAKWILVVDGEIENSQKMDWLAFLKMPATESKSDFHCVEGWSVRDCTWYGVKFSSLVQLVKPMKDARYVFFSCADGYTTSLGISDLLKDDVLLAYKLNGEDLDDTLGGPLRLVVPQRYAYKSAMYVERITFTKKKGLGYWEKRGYSDTADVWRNDRRAR